MFQRLRWTQAIRPVALLMDLERVFKPNFAAFADVGIPSGSGQKIEVKLRLLAAVGFEVWFGFDSFPNL
jgi:hypothetical protein